MILESPPWNEKRRMKDQNKSMRAKLCQHKLLFDTQHVSCFPTYLSHGKNVPDESILQICFPIQGRTVCVILIKLYFTKHMEYSTIYKNATSNAKKLEDFLQKVQTFEKS